MLAKLWTNADTLLLAGAVAGGAFFLQSQDEHVSQLREIVAEMQAFDEAWLQIDNEQTADLAALIEEVRTAQGTIIGRLDGIGGGALLYQIGLRDGRAACDGR